MDLILAEQTLLIALDDTTGRDRTQWGSDAGLAGALLLDLARLELLTADPDGKLVAVDGAPPGHELARDAYGTIRRSSKRRSPKGWVQRLPRELKPLRQRLARGLVKHGILAEAHSKRFGVLPTTRFPTHDPAPDQELRERLRERSSSPAATRPSRRRSWSAYSSAVRDAIRAVQAAVIAAIVAAASSTLAGSG